MFQSQFFSPSLLNKFYEMIVIKTLFYVKKFSYFGIVKDSQKTAKDSQKTAKDSQKTAKDSER